MWNRDPFLGNLGLKVTLALSILALQSQVSLGAPPGKPGKAADMPVTTTIIDVDAAGNAYTFQSDGNGTYLHGVDNVVSILTVNGYNGIPNGDWQFNKPVEVRNRRVNLRNVGISLNMADAIQVGDPHYQAPADPPFWGTQVLYGNSQVKCTLQNKSMLTMTANTAMTCPMLITFFTADELKHGLHPAKSWTNFPETDDAQITCNAVDSVGCKDWDIEPIGSLRAVARLTSEVSPNSFDVNNLGDFYVRFKVHITRP